jgi:hypothetical protein
VLPQIEEWQNRQLADVYPIVFIDAIVFTLGQRHLSKNIRFCVFGIYNQSFVWYAMYIFIYIYIFNDDGRVILCRVKAAQVAENLLFMRAQRGENVRNAALKQNFRQAKVEASNAHFATHLQCKTTFAINVVVR